MTGFRSTVYVVQEYDEDNNKWDNVSDEHDRLSIAKDDYVWLKMVADGELRIVSITTTILEDSLNEDIKVISGP